MVLAHMLAPKSAPGAANQYEQIEYYASQELAGKLTVGEMDDYLSKPGFAVANGQIVVRENTQSFPEGFTPPNGRLIRPCAKEGFLIHQGSIDGYCEGFSYYSFSVSPQQYGGASDWEDLVGYAYDNRDEIHFRPSGLERGIEARIRGAADGVAGYLAALGLAEDQLREMPASTVDSLTEAERSALVVTKGCEILENEQVVEELPYPSHQPLHLFRRPHEIRKQRVRGEGFAFQLRVKLHPDKPRMILHFDNLGQFAVGAHA